MREKESEKGSFPKVVKVLVILAIIAGICVAGGYAALNAILAEHDNGEIKLAINFTNVTGKTKHDIIVEDNIIYLSMDDIDIYYDNNIYYDSKYNQIVTSTEDKLAVLKLGEKEIEINGNKKTIKGAAMEKNKAYYLPISEMEDVYNIKVKKVDNNIAIESLEKKSTKGVIKKNVYLKAKAKDLSGNIMKLKKGSEVRVADIDKTSNSMPKGWVKVRTENGRIGYIKQKDITNLTTEREEKVSKKIIDGKVSLAWDYFSEYAKAPDNSGVKYDGVNVVSPSFFYLSLKDMQKAGAIKMNIENQAKVNANVGESGEKYIKWAKDNGYKVWPMFSNETLTTTID